MGCDPSGENIRVFDMVNDGGGSGALDSIAYYVPIAEAFHRGKRNSSGKRVCPDEDSRPFKSL